MSNDGEEELRSKWELPHLGRLIFEVEKSDGTYHGYFTPFDFYVLDDLTYHSI